MNRQFPCLEVHLDRLYHNARQVISRCEEQGIRVCGVIKGVNGMPEMARTMRRAGAVQIGTSRLDQVARMPTSRRAIVASGAPSHKSGCRRCGTK